MHVTATGIDSVSGRTVPTPPAREMPHPHASSAVAALEKIVFITTP